MLRIIKMSGNFYGVKLTDDHEYEMNEIEMYANEGTLVIIVEDLDALADLGISDHVTMIVRD